jgi:hypothetical protein
LRDKRIHTSEGIRDEERDANDENLIHFNWLGARSSKRLLGKQNREKADQHPIEKAG